MISAGKFIFGNTVLFYFKDSLAVLELCSIRLKIIRFILNVLSHNFAAFDCITVFASFTAFTLRFACVIIVQFDCEFAVCKFVGIYVYVNGLDYRFFASVVF